MIPNEYITMVHLQQIQVTGLCTVPLNTTAPLHTNKVNT